MAQIKQREYHAERYAKKNLPEVIAEEVDHLPKIECFSKIGLGATGSGTGNGLAHQ